MLEFLRLRRGAAFSRAVTAGSAVSPRTRGALSRWTGAINIWFWGIVGLPTLAAAVYFFGIASNLYLTEAKFVVRAPTKLAIPSITSMLSGAGSVPGLEDTYSVSEFIMSRDAVRKLDTQADLRDVLSRPEGDFISRFPGYLFWRKDFEALYAAYARFVSVEIDSQSGIATLSVKAYRPEDAQNIARVLLTYSEQLVNDLNERARKDALATFEREVATTKKRIELVQAELTAYRMKQNMLDPKSAAEGPLKLLANLITQQTTAQTQLADLLRNSPHSPQIALVRTRITSLDRQIAEQRAKITGAGDSVAAAVTEYERLSVELGLDEKALASAFASLEAARLEAQRQQLYLETISQPNLADYPLYPRRVVSFIIVTVSCLLAYGIAWLLVASVREHASA